MMIKMDTFVQVVLVVRTSTRFLSVRLTHIPTGIVVASTVDVVRGAVTVR